MGLCYGFGGGARRGCERGGRREMEKLLFEYVLLTIVLYLRSEMHFALLSYQLQLTWRLNED